MAVALKMWTTVLPLFISVGVVFAGILVYRIVNNSKINKYEKKKKLLMDSLTKYKIPLIEKEELTHDTRRFRFGLPSSEHILGLPVGQHINIIARINDDLVIRAYTPVSSDDDRGYLDLVVKIYFKNVHPQFPAGGKMSQYLDSLKIGDCIEIRGPAGKITYVGEGLFSFKKLRDQPPETLIVDTISMIAGGTGITPMLQLIRNVIKHDQKDIKMALLYANQTENDILVRKELDEVAAKYPNQFKVWYTVDKPSPDWKFSVGFINDEMIKDHLLPPDDKTVVLMCGPPPMIKFACFPNLKKLLYNEHNCIAY